MIQEPPYGATPAKITDKSSLLYRESGMMFVRRHVFSARTTHAQLGQLDPSWSMVSLCTIGMGCFSDSTLDTDLNQKKM
jgi:hypothetical protein